MHGQWCTSMDCACVILHLPPLAIATSTYNHSYFKLWPQVSFTPLLCPEHTTYLTLQLSLSLSLSPNTYSKHMLNTYAIFLRPTNQKAYSTTHAVPDQPRTKSLFLFQLLREGIEMGARYKANTRYYSHQINNMIYCDKLFYWKENLKSVHWMSIFVHMQRVFLQKL